MKKGKKLFQAFIEPVSKEDFYFKYIGYISPIYKLKSEVAKSVLSWLCINANS